MRLFWLRRAFLPLLVLFVFAGTVFGEAALASTALTNDVGYVVQNGDSLSRIASQFQVSVNEILAVNPDLQNNPDLIQTGLILAIPQGGAAIQVYLEPPVDPADIPPITVAAPDSMRPGAAVNLDLLGIPFTIASGLRGGVVQYVDYSNSSSTGCGDGSYTGENNSDLTQIYGELLLMTDTKVTTTTADANGKSCVTISTTYAGTQLPPTVFVEGYQVPYRGPFLSARNYANFGVIETEVSVDCNDSYTLTVGLRANDGQLVENVLQIAVPCN